MVYYPDPFVDGDDGGDVDKNYDDDDGDDDEAVRVLPLIRFDYNNYGDEDDSEEGVIPPDLRSNPPEELGDELARDPRRYSSVDTATLEQGRRSAAHRRRSVYGFNTDAIIDGFRDASFGGSAADQMNASMTHDGLRTEYVSLLWFFLPLRFFSNWSNLVRRSRGDDSNWLSETPVLPSSARQMSMVSDWDQPFEEPAPLDMVPSSDSNDFQLEVPAERSEYSSVHYLDDDDEHGSGGVSSSAQRRAKLLQHQLAPVESITQQQKEKQAPRPPPRKRVKKRKAMSDLGLEYPPFPSRVVKKLAKATHAKIGNETLKVLTECTSLFFAQAASDLGAYARHAARRTIEEADVIQLMKRYVSLFYLQFFV